MDSARDNLLQPTCEWVFAFCFLGCQSMNLVKLIPNSSRTSPVALCFALFVLSVAAADNTPAGYLRGKPWTGSMGITETVEEIMARADSNSIVEIHEAHSTLPMLDKSLQANPLAPLVAQWPKGSAPPSPPVPRPFLPQIPSTSFQGTSLSESGFIPPDSMGAVGPTQVIVMSNGRIKVFSKAGASGPLNTSTDTFFNSVRASFSASDGHVRYDRLSGR